MITLENNISSESFPEIVGECVANEQLDKLKQLEINEITQGSLLSLVNLIPVCGGAIAALIQTKLSYSDIRFVRKLFGYVYGIGDQSIKKRQQFLKDLEKCANDHSGIVLCDIIDKIDNINKTTLLANLTKKQISGEISTEDFLRLSNIANRIPYTDYKYLPYFQKHNYIDGGVTELLYATGVLYHDIISEDGSKYFLSDNGIKLLKYGLNYDMDSY